MLKMRTHKVNDSKDKIFMINLPSSLHGNNLVRITQPLANARTEFNSLLRVFSLLSNCDNGHVFSQMLIGLALSGYTYIHTYLTNGLSLNS